MVLPGSALRSIHDFAGVFGEMHALISLNSLETLVEMCGTAT